jgi:hypothetical protein
MGLWELRKDFPDEINKRLKSLLLLGARFTVKGVGKQKDRDPTRTSITRSDRARDKSRKKYYRWI